ncbi:MAG: Crp/Fnr family transcriptional regulator [Bacilli bacterium]
MNNYYILKENTLFKNMSEDDVNSLFLIGNSYIKKYEKNEIILREGDSNTNIYFILEGMLSIYQSDIDGNPFLKSKQSPPDAFAYIFALTKHASNCTVFANSSATILVVNLDTIMHSNSSTVIKFKNNLIISLANATYNTSSHLSILSLKSLRYKIFNYLAKFNYISSTYFTIPLNREEMAQYLGVNRTSLSKELIALKAEKILDYHKNKFIILNIDYFEDSI